MCFFKIILVLHIHVYIHIHRYMYVIQLFNYYKKQYISKRFDFSSNFPNTRLKFLILIYMQF